MARAEPSDEAPTRAERRDAYESILRIVEYNTGDGGPALAKQTSILLTAGHAGIGADRARSMIQAAIGNRDLVRVGDRIARTDDASLQDVVAEMEGRDPPREDVVKWCRGQMEDA